VPLLDYYYTCSSTQSEKRERDEHDFLCIWDGNNGVLSENVTYFGMRRS